MSIKTKLDIIKQVHSASSALDKPKHNWVWISGLFITIIGYLIPLSTLPSSVTWIKYGMMIGGIFVCGCWVAWYLRDVGPIGP
jgi:hypothetical protein